MKSVFFSLVISPTFYICIDLTYDESVPPMLWIPHQLGKFLVLIEFLFQKQRFTPFFLGIYYLASVFNTLISKQNNFKNYNLRMRQRKFKFIEFNQINRVCCKYNTDLIISCILCFIILTYLPVIIITHPKEADFFQRKFKYK